MSRVRTTMNRRTFVAAVVGAAAGVARERSLLALPEEVSIGRTELLDFTNELIRIPSFTTEETRIARFLDDFFRREGLQSELQEVDPGRFQTIARLKGSGGE
jgi:hypothetical protein